MTAAVIGATGCIGSEIVRGLLARGEEATALVRDPGKARSAFGEAGGLRIRRLSVLNTSAVAEFLHEHRTECV